MLINYLLKVNAFALIDKMGNLIYACNFFHSIWFYMNISVRNFITDYLSENTNQS